MGNARAFCKICQQSEKKLAIEYVSLKSELSEPSDDTRLLLLAGEKCFWPWRKVETASKHELQEVARWGAVQVIPSVLVVAEVCGGGSAATQADCAMLQGWCENQLTLIKRFGEKKKNI